MPIFFFDSDADFNNIFSIPILLSQNSPCFLYEANNFFKAPSLISCIIDVQCLFLNCFKLFTIGHCKLKIICILKSESIILAECPIKNKSNILIQISLITVLKKPQTSVACLFK